MYYSSNDDSGKENSNVLMKTPKKWKRSASVEPVSDDEGCNSVPETPADNEESGPHKTSFEEFESDLSDGLSSYENPASAPPDDTSSVESNGNDTDTDSTGDNFQECSSQTPLYPGCNLTSENLDALLLALFKKHQMSEAAKEDLVKVLELTLPAENNVATSSLTDLTNDMKSAHFLMSLKNSVQHATLKWKRRYPETESVTTKGKK